MPPKNAFPRYGNALPVFKFLGVAKYVAAVPNKPCNNDCFRNFSSSAVPKMPVGILLPNGVIPSNKPPRPDETWLVSDDNGLLSNSAIIYPLYPYCANCFNLNNSSSVKGLSCGFTLGATLTNVDDGSNCGLDI